MFGEVLSLTYHSPITIESLTYRLLLGTLQYSSGRVSFVSVDGHHFLLAAGSRRERRR